MPADAHAPDDGRSEGDKEGEGLHSQGFGNALCWQRCKCWTKYKRKMTPKGRRQGPTIKLSFQSGNTLSVHPVSPVRRGRTAATGPRRDPPGGGHLCAGRTPARVLAGVVQPQGLSQEQGHTMHFKSAASSLTWRHICGVSSFPVLPLPQGMRIKY